MLKVFYFVILACAIISSSVSAANPQVTFHITGAASGEIILELYPEKAPVTVENFINYVKNGSYDGLIFHRVIKGFMIQSGGFDPNFVNIPTDPPIKNEDYNGLSNLPGTISMARTAHPDSATSQFFINHGNNTVDADPDLPETNLDRKLVYDYYNAPYYKVGYAVFGEVISGMEIVEAIANLPTLNGVDIPDVGVFDNVPVDDVIIESAVISNRVCLEKIEGDIDEDCDVDLSDFAKLAANWLECNAINGCQ